MVASISAQKTLRLDSLCQVLRWLELLDENSRCWTGAASRRLITGKSLAKIALKLLNLPSVAAANRRIAVPIAKCQ